ncbi:ATP-binding cassette transporter abc4 [Aspergillus udagawae]|nr:ATP-binding cassette transporter abc4 [Aspergillus udagawae]
MQAQKLDRRAPSSSTAQVFGEFNHTQASLDVEFARSQGSTGLDKAQFEPIAYAPQEPWLFRGSIKDNIVFGTAYDQKRYERVIRDCALEKDLAAFKDGDLKEVGEGGRSLSGGQRQRVSLARAMYTNANVVILDDILSGLDPSTFEWVVTRCVFRSLQRNRTIIMVTNSQKILQMADLVIHTENGKIAQVKKNLSSTRWQSVPDTDYVDCLFHDRPEASETLSATFESTGRNDERDPVSAEAPNECADFQRVSSLRYAVEYLRSFGSRPFVTLAVISAVGAHGLEIGLPAWLSIWSAISARNEDAGRDGFYLGIYTGMTSPPDHISRQMLTTRAGLGSAQIAILAVSLLLLYSGAWRSSRDKHMEMISAIFGTTYTWIWSTPVGQVINRFSSDVASLDDTLFRTFRPVLDTYLSIGLRILTVTSLIPLFFLPSVVLSGFAIYVGYRYRFAATAVKHIYAASLTPLHHSIAETASGLRTIHAFRAQAMLQKRFDAAVEHHVQAWNAVSDLQRWLAVRMDIFVALISCSAATLAILRPNSSAPVVGLSLTLTTGLCTALLYLVYLSSLLEVEMASYCRIKNYIQGLPQEDSSAKLDACAVEHWPTRGLISFDNYGASYSLDGEEVLKGVNYRANAGQRTAIVGRTGSGKTSLALSLLRLTTRTRGSISIDGVDIESVSVENLRQSISFIPQDPTMLDGTIRFNLDFNGEYDEGYLQSILDDVVGTRKWRLDDTVEQNGRNFSQGERQLITLARAMVSKHKILIIDEGTASLDKASEDRIMAVIRDCFSECTVIAITHRLHSIVDFDRVLVMGDGQVLEAGNPRHLLGGESLFKALYLQQCGTDAHISGNLSDYRQS